MPKLLTGNLKLELFKEKINEETAYILGILWADGYLQNNSIQIEIIEDDAKDIQHIFKNTGLWNLRNRTRKHWKPQTCIGISNKEFANFLYENDYKQKSLVSAQKILSNIPDELKQFWYRGYWDGDGCFYYNEKNKFFQCTAAGTINQDWTFLETLFNSLKLGYNIRKVANKHSYSCIRTTGRHQVASFIKYLYSSNTHIGLKRKYEKAMLILQKYEDINGKI